jgi:predicted Zn-dependent protease
MFGAPPREGKDLVNIFGLHDPDYRICVMRQGLSVPSDWVKFGEDMIKNKRIYCKYCEDTIRKNLKQKEID